MEGNAAKVFQKPPFRKVNWLPRDIAVERRPDGVIVLKSRFPLNDYLPHIPAALARWAVERPDHTWLAQRRGPNRDWHRVSYSEAKRTVDALTQAILDMKLPEGAPVAILSGNSIEHALMTQAAMQARLPAAPVSPAYSLMSQDHAKLKYLFGLIKPKLVMVQDGPTFAKALNALDLTGITVVHVDRPAEGVASVAYADLAATKVTDAVAQSIAKITPDTIGKLLFTSGSTGMPKAVINTQRMMCANAMMMMQVRPRDPNGPLPVFLDWMPWNHTMGGNALFNPALIEGGTLYIDDGRPVPGQFEETLRNLREISPTYYANAPVGYAVLAAAMEKDDALCRSFFKNLGIMGYGGARLPDDLYDRMQALAVRAAATPKMVAQEILAGDRLMTPGACQPCSMALRTASAIALAEAGKLEEVDHRLNEAERIAGMWHGGPWAAALWEARGVQRRAQKKEVRALAAFEEAASRYEELGRPRDQARCLARMGPEG